MDGWMMMMMMMMCFFCSFGGVVLVFCVCFLAFLICVVGKSER